MEHHVETGVWGLVWVAYVFCYTIIALTVYFIEIWPYEHLNDDDSDNNDDTYVINFYYSDDSDDQNTQ